MPKKIAMPLEKTGSKNAEPIQVMLDAGTSTAAEVALGTPEEGQAAEPTGERDEECCAIKLPLDFAGAGMGMHLDHIFRAEGFWNPTLEKYQYKLLFDPWPKYANVMQTFTDFLHAVYPCVKRVSSNWSLSEENFGPGHTSRRRARTFWTWFEPGQTSMFHASNPPLISDLWQYYYENPVTEGNQPVTPNIGLDFNENYNVSHGTWIDTEEGCEIPRRSDCLSAGVWTNFNFRTSGDSI